MLVSLNTKVYFVVSVCDHIRNLTTIISDNNHGYKINFTLGFRVRTS